jgi:LuxR family transcriptional regulator, positive regulator of biofilm formation
MLHSARIYIVGPNTLLNQLIGFAVQSELNEEYEIFSNVEWLASGESGAAPRCLFLVDDSDSTARASLFRLLAEKQEDEGPCIIAALFNVDLEQSCSYQAIQRGIKGLFFDTDPIERVLKGVTMLLDGEVWIPQEVLVRAATRREEETGFILEQSRLTMREMEVLSLVSTGATNDQIAASLFISPHTVKTHMYNIFQKIGVENRLHAAMWASRHLRGRMPSFLSSPQAAT